MNPLIRVMHAAESQRWCVSTWCTTCGHREFAEALVKSESPPDHTIASSLMEIDFDELQSTPNWQSYIQSIFQRRRGPGKPPILSPAERQQVLQRWSTRLTDSVAREIRFIDFAMFYLVRNEPEASEALLRWVDRSIYVLRESGDRSLTETLIYFARRHDYFRDGILSTVLELIPADGIIKDALDRLAVPEKT